MAVTLLEPEAEMNTPAAKSPEKLPDAGDLQDRMPEWFRSSRQLTAAVSLLGLAFAVFSFRPLWHTDLWGHLAYGRLICETGSLPETEPFMPLAEGVPVINYAWLSQVIGYMMYSQFGVTALQFLYGASITFCLGLLAWRLHQRTGHIGFVLLGITAFLWVDWQALKIIRPQLAGLCCFVSMFVLLTSRRLRRSDFVLVPIITALWANLHGSFLLALLLPATFCVGRVIDVLCRAGSLSAVWKDRRVRRFLMFTELAAVAVLLNPSGLGIYSDVFVIAGNPNLHDLFEWEPLTLRAMQGQAAFAVGLAIIYLLRFSPRRVFAAEALLLMGLGAAALWSSRFLVWWGPIAANSLAMHAWAVCRQRRWSFTETRPLPRRSLWTVASLGLVWVFFGFTPFGMRLVHGKEAELSRSVSATTPLGATAYLNEHPPKGQIFNSYELGDYLVWAGPKNLRVFTTSHAHLVPREVWQHYVRIVTIDDDWQSLLDRYGVNTVVIDPQQQDALAMRLNESPTWQLVFADDRTEIYERIQESGMRNQ